MAWDALRPLGLMALQALAAVAQQPRRLVAILLERVEHSSGLGVRGGELQNRPAAHPPHVDVVVEVDGARIAGMDQPELGARFRENERLRRDGDVEGFQNGIEPAAAIRLEGELDVARRHAAVELGQRVL